MRTPTAFTRRAQHTLLVVLLAAIVVPAPLLAIETGNSNPNQQFTDYGSEENCKSNPLLCNLGVIGEETQLGGMDVVEFRSWNGVTVYEGGPAAIAARIINTLLSLLGIVTMATVFYGGFLWMTAQGNEETIKKAKDILVGTAIGLLLILASYSILSAVFTALARTSRLA